MQWPIGGCDSMQETKQPAELVPYDIMRFIIAILNGLCIINILDIGL